MFELFQYLQTKFSEPLSDGRQIFLKLRDNHTANPVLIVTAAIDNRDKFLARIYLSDNLFVVRQPWSQGEKANSAEGVFNILQQLCEPYSNKCWKCKSPVTMTAENRCPKCRQFVVCQCGMCFCDMPNSRLWR